MKILIIDFTVDHESGESFRSVLSHNFKHLISNVLVIRPNDLNTIPNHDVLILSGAAIPIESTPPWSGLAEEFLKKEILDNKTPTLGVCYGSQFIAKIFGAKVGKTNSPEIGSILVETSDSSSWLLNSIKTLNVYSYHYDSIFESFMIHNEKISITAASSQCSIQAYESKNFILAGTQFHPEKNDADVKTMLAKNKGNPYLINSGEVQNKLRFQIFENFLIRAKNAV